MPWLREGKNAEAMEPDVPSTLGTGVEGVRPRGNWEQCWKLHNESPALSYRELALRCGMSKASVFRALQCMPSDKPKAGGRIDRTWCPECQEETIHQRWICSHCGRANLPAALVPKLQDYDLTRNGDTCTSQERARRGAKTSNRLNAFKRLLSTGT